MENENSNYQTIINVYNNIKDNLSMITVIPLLLGGIWQALKLSSISVAYIRFFSVTQLVSDGLLILFVLGVLILASGLAHRIDIPFFDLKYESISKSTLGILWLIAVAVFVTFSFYYYFYSLLFEYKLNVDNFQLSHFFFGVFIYIFLSKNVRAIIIVTIAVVEKILNISSIYPKVENNLERVFPFIMTILFIINIQVIANQFTVFNRSYLLPSELYNLKMVEDKYSKKFKNTKTKVIYYNDKYIFIAVNDQSKHIIIVPFDELFKSE